MTVEPAFFLNLNTASYLTCDQVPDNIHSHQGFEVNKPETPS